MSEVTTVKVAKSLMGKIRVKMGEMSTGMACAMVDPVKRVRTLRTRPDWSETLLIIDDLLDTGMLFYHCRDPVILRNLLNGFP